MRAGYRCNAQNITQILSGCYAHTIHGSGSQNIVPGCWMLFGRVYALCDLLGMCCL